MRHVVVTVLMGSLVCSGCANPPPPELPPEPPPPPSASVAPMAPPPPQASSGPVKRQRVRQTEFSFDAHDALKLPAPVEFEGATDKLSPASDEVLEVVHDYLDQNPDVTLFRIEGHTDSDNTTAANEMLSEKRAMAVARWLVGVGVACERLIPVGFGQTKPIAPNDTTANKAQNRRIVFVKAAIRRKPIGGLIVDGGGTVAGDPCR